MEPIIIQSTVRERWSPRVFMDIEIDNARVEALIEAARWAPSSRNSQPWRFIYATKDNGAIWHKLLDCLADGNKLWAQSASLLLLACAVTIDPVTHTARKHAWYDLGLAVSNLTFQANAMGIYVRNMGGFDPGKATGHFAIPDGIDPVVMLAAGYPDETIREHPLFAVTTRENRSRAEVGKLVYKDSWDDLIW